MAIEDQMRARFATMTLAELKRTIEQERGRYVPRAIELAEEELARRTTPGSYRDDALARESIEEAETKPRMQWWHAWVAAIAAGSVVNVVARLLIRGFSLAIIPSLLWAAFIIPVALRLRRTGHPFEPVSPSKPKTRPEPPRSE